MSYLDKVTVGSTTYDLQDTKAQNDVSALKSAVSVIDDALDSGGTYVPEITWTSGKYINIANNTITNGNSDLYISNYISLPPKAHAIKVKNVRVFDTGYTIAFYNASKVFVSGVQRVGAVANNPDFYTDTIPDTAKYIIIGHYANSTYPVSNTSVLIYEYAALTNLGDDVSALDATMNDAALDRTYHNILAGATTFTDNKFVNESGSVVTNNNYCLIDGFYPVKAETTYRLYRGEPSLYSNAGHNWTFWDANKGFLSYKSSGGAVTSPEGAAYLRFGVYISNTGSATHQDFDPTKVIVTEDANPCFDDTFTAFISRPSFAGKKWIGVGDSMTEANFRATYHYWDYITAETGLSFVNMGVSGSGYKAEGSGDKAFYKRVASMATDADVITIFGGVNDVVLSNADIGTETDTGTTTICGCVNETLDAIEALYPAHMPIGIISPLPCACVDTTVNLHPLQNPSDDTCRMAVFVEQLVLICKHKGIPFLDLFHQSNLRPWNEECNAKYFSCDSAKTGDGLHPNGHGHRLIYRQIQQFVEKLVMG